MDSLNSTTADVDALHSRNNLSSSNLSPTEHQPPKAAPAIKEHLTAANGVVEYGKDQITVDFTDYTKGLLDITSEVEVSNNVEIGNLNGSSDFNSEQKGDMDTMETEKKVDSAPEPAPRTIRVSSEDTLYCFCRQPWDQNNVRFMIECSQCKGWFHGSCVGVPEKLGSLIESYFCKACAPTAGPIVYKDPNEKPIKAGTKEFLRKLKGKEYLSATKIVKKLKGENLTLNEFYQNGFSKPILVENISELDMRVPKRNFTVRQVEAYVGSELEVDVIDVERQTDIAMSMKEFCDYFTYPARNKLYNLISLEFSKTRLDHLVEAPAVVRKLDWVNSWKRHTDMEPPTVSKYCLISAKESFTDFHIDFGGTSVWYHVLWGEKVFYLIEPTSTNLLLYQKWMSSNPQNYETFFADTVDYCYQIVLKAGETLFIPTGWIHAVLTTEDSLVFGGNFLNHLNVDIQLSVYAIEKTLCVPTKYLFPHFETCTWFASKDMVEIFESLNALNLYPTHFIDGLRSLRKALKSWTGDDTDAREVVPSGVKPKRLIKRISRIVRKCDRREKDARKLANKNRKSSLSSSLQSTSNPTSPDVPSCSSSESDPIRIRSNSLSKKRGNRISGSSSSSTYTAEQVPIPPAKPIKIKIRRISMSDNSSPSSPNPPAQDNAIASSYFYYPSPSSPYNEQFLALSPVDLSQTVEQHQFSATENNGSCGSQNTDKHTHSTSPDYDSAWQAQMNYNQAHCVDVVPQENLEENESENSKTDGLKSNDTETQTTNSTGLRIVEPDYYDENGFGHYITNEILVEPVGDPETPMNQSNIETTGNQNDVMSSPKYKAIEPSGIDESGKKHYISPHKLAVLDSGSSSCTDTNSSLTTHCSESDVGKQTSSQEGTFGVSTGSSIESSQNSPTDGGSTSTDQLVIVASSDDESGKHKHRHHKHHHKHRHHKKSKKAKPEDSSESARKKHKKHKKHRHAENKHSDNTSLNCALAGALDGMETLLKDSKYNERLAEKAQRATTSASMKEAISEIIENESVPLEKRLKRTKTRKAADPWSEENIQKVHQDDDYIYLPLAGESDEEISPKRQRLSAKEKRKDKEAWCPSVKIGQVAKRDACPTRHKAKVVAVEKGLENAAAALSKGENRAKSTTPKKKKIPTDLKLKVVKPTSEASSSNEWKLVSKNGGKATQGPSSSGQKPAAGTTEKKPPKKGKKGLMTPRQRLLKILNKSGKHH